MVGLWLEEDVITEKGPFGVLPVGPVRRIIKDTKIYQNGYNWVNERKDFGDVVGAAMSLATMAMVQQILQRVITKLP